MDANLKTFKATDKFSPFPTQLPFFPSLAARDKQAGQMTLFVPL
jgi:hypothetical protein